MTRYTVVWHQGAQDQLAELWLEGPDRSDISAAANAIDIRLAKVPETSGIAVQSGLRLLIIWPLRVLFTVSEPDRMVRVVHVARS